MKEIRPIPTPVAIRWREFRINVVPILIFVVVLGIVAWIWSVHVTPPLMIGQVEPLRADVVSIKDGTLVKLDVDLYQPVYAGQPLAAVLPADPKLIESTVAVIQAEAELLKAQIEMETLSQSRAITDFAQLQLELLQQKTLLVANKVKLQYLEAELSRYSELREKAIVAESEYELIKNQRDTLIAEVAERENLISTIQRQIDQLQKILIAEDKFSDSLLHKIQASLELQQQKIRLAEAELGPVVLQAPIDGIVTFLYRRRGENVVAGEPIMTISSTNASRIIAYVLPPWTEEIQTGQQVEVMRRTPRRETAVATIQFVGVTMEPVPPTLFNPIGSRAVGLNRVPINIAQLGGQIVEIGRPVVISLPKEFSLYPGELVDIRYKRFSGWSLLPNSSN